MQIAYTSRFLRAYKKLPDPLKLLVKERGLVFQKDPFDPRLKTLKLGGRFDEFWAFWINYHNRVIFEFGKNDTVYFHLVGDHTIYEGFI